MNQISEYALCHSRKPDSRCSPDVRITRSGSGWPDVYRCPSIPSTLIALTRSSRSALQPACRAAGTGRRRRSPAAAVADRDVDVGARAATGALGGFPQPPRLILRSAGRACPTIFTLQFLPGRDLLDHLGDDLEQRVELLGLAPQVLGGQKVDGAISIPAASHQRSSFRDLARAHPMTMADTSVNPFSRAHRRLPSHITATWRGCCKTVETAQEPSLVDAVQQAAQLHLDITTGSKTTPRTCGARAEHPSVANASVRPPSRLRYRSYCCVAFAETVPWSGTTDRARHDGTRTRRPPVKPRMRGWIHAWSLVVAIPRERRPGIARLHRRRAARRNRHPRLRRHRLRPVRGEHDVPPDPLAHGSRPDVDETRPTTR